MSTENPDGLSNLFKGPSNETLKKLAQQTRSYAYKYARALTKELNVITGARTDRINMGPIKLADAADRKAVSQFDGDRNKLDDYCRLQIFTHNPKEMQKVLTLFGTSGMNSHKFHKTMNDKGCNYRHLEQPRDYITKPKRWGWMGVQLKMETNLNKGKVTKFEVQIFDKGMKEAYDESHLLYEKIKTPLEQWEQSSLEIHDVLTRAELSVAKDILRLHREAAINCGLYNFTNGTFPELNDAIPLIKESDISPLTSINDGINPDIKPDEYTAD